jgi:hypothetical protein
MTDPLAETAWYHLDDDLTVCVAGHYVATNICTKTGTPVMSAQVRAEVERLRGIIQDAGLEWVSDPDVPSGQRCPICHVTTEPHFEGCWLAAELARNASDPPEGSQP